MDLSDLLTPQLNAARAAEMPSLLFEALRANVAATSMRLLLVDLEERSLQPCATAGPDADRLSGAFRTDHSIHGGVYATGTPARLDLEGMPALIVPVSVRAERIGVLEVTFDDDPPADAESALVSFGLLLGYLLAVSEGWSDEFVIARRRTEMALAAEIQWNVLPRAACSAGGVSIVGALEPAYAVGGDGYDYAFGERHVAAALFDAMGRGIRASRAMAFGIAAYRNARRRNLSLEEQARSIHGEMWEFFATEGFLTGQLLAIDVASPEESLIVNAGHPLPVIQRGAANATVVELEAQLPFGVPLPNRLQPQALPLSRGDRLLLYSDGIVEARPEGGEQLGERRLLSLMDELRGLGPREAARNVISAVRAHRAGDLTDDATLLVVDIGA